MAGPDCPPFSRASRESTRRLWAVFSPPWQRKHVSISTGRIRVLNNVSGSSAAKALETTTSTGTICNSQRPIITCPVDEVSGTQGLEHTQHSHFVSAAAEIAQLGPTDHPRTLTL